MAKKRPRWDDVVSTHPTTTHAALLPSPLPARYQVEVNLVEVVVAGTVAAGICIPGMMLFAASFHPQARRLPARSARGPPSAPPAYPRSSGLASPDLA